MSFERLMDRLNAGWVPPTMATLFIASWVVTLGLFFEPLWLLGIPAGVLITKEWRVPLEQIRAAEEGDR
jgi:hypothetical protein